MHHPHLEGYYYSYIRSFLAQRQLNLEIHGINTLPPPPQEEMTDVSWTLLMIVMHSLTKKFKKYSFVRVTLK